jgi:hypothetical protein
MFIIVIAVIPGAHGVGASFLLTGASFSAAVWMLWRWDRPPQRAAVHGEEIWGAIRSGFLYNLHSPANRAILLRVFTFIVPAVVMWSQVPIIATRQLGLQREFAEKGSAMLFAFIGMGAIFGVLIMPGLQKRYRIDPVVNVCTACFAGGLIVLSFVHHLWLAAFIMVFLGINWVIIPTNFNTATQTSVPMWVKGRAISFYLTVLFGSFTVAALIWGNLTTATSIHTSLLAGGISMAALLTLAYWFPLTLNEGLDLTPAFKPATPAPAAPAGENGSTPATPAKAAGILDYATAEIGPVQLTVDYQISPSKREEFLGIMNKVGQQRRRNGAVGWRIDRGESPGHWHETFRFHSRGEHARQNGRMTMADLQIHERAKALHVGEQPPAIRQQSAEASCLRNWLIQRGVESVLRGMEEAMNFHRRLSR